MPQADAVPDTSAVLVAGPWTHRAVAANGTRFHVAEMGEGPMVLLMHGFPTFWWSMRHQVTTLAAHGYRAVAVDLRGYGASDKPPRGYDGYTLAADMAGLVRALGARTAVFAGHDWGGFAAWCVATLHPGLVRGLVVMAAPHPRRLRAAVAIDPRGQLLASRHLAGFQRPWVPERQLVRDDAALVARMLHAWSALGWPDDESERRYRDHMRIPHVAHSALEYFRWALRSQLRPDGWRFARRMSAPVAAPTLQLHGALDTAVLPRTAAGSGRYVSGRYSARVIEQAGHFLHEEAPKEVNAELLHWLDELDRSR